MQIELLNSCLAEPLCVNQIQYSVAHCPTIDAGLNVNICNEAGCSRDGSVIEYCRLKKMTIQAWSPFLYGMFEGVYIGNEKFPELNRVMDRLAEEYQVTPNAIAVAWIMRLYFEFQRLGFYDMIDGMPTLMRDLHARGVRLWGLTNFTVRGVREMHGKYPWLNLLGGTVISAQEGVAKPDPRIYDIAIGRFHLDPAQTLFVDDNACNVLAARAAGLQAVRFESAAQIRALTLD